MNKPALKVYNKDYYKKNFLKRRDEQLKRNYGITAEYYYKLHDLQKGLCAICRRSNKRGSLCVDHDHNTGQVRGLLCTVCNLAVGHIENAKASALLEYIIKWLPQKKKEEAA